MPDAAATAIAHPRIHNGRPTQKSTMAEIAEASGDAPKGHRMGFATSRKRARPQLVKTLIATVERFTDSGNAPRTDIGGLDALATTTGRSKGSEGQTMSLGDGRNRLPAKSPSKTGLICVGDITWMEQSPNVRVNIFTHAPVADE